MAFSIIHSVPYLSVCSIFELLFILRETTRHTNVLVFPSRNQNGIIQSFVASKKNYLFVKRSFDIFCSCLVIIGIISWLLPIIALLIKVSSKGPVFFRQKRVGRNGKPFRCIKFRTMILNSEADEIQAGESDPRITRFGRFLRSTHMDEFPQFFNVLAGQMSVVGPRPHMLKDCIRFSFVISSYSFRTLVRPGITGWAQVKGCRGPTRDYESIIVRYYWDAQYVRKSGLWLDLKIMGITLAQSMHSLVKTCFRSSRQTENDPRIFEMKRLRKVETGATIINNQ
jgi:putative colanic acid biosysnthesis UDP-glucose lipid carrier transferase